VAEYLPCPHCTHSAEPVLGLNEPAAHRAHGPPSLPVEPMLQVQAASSTLDAGALERTGQSEHSSEAIATASEYLPATQLSQTSEAAPSTAEYLPASQPSHTSEAAATASENLPATQLSHTSAEAASNTEYLPAMHTEHAAKPVAVLYLPAAQAVHGPPSAPVKPGLHWQADCVVLPSSEIEFAGQ